MEGSSEVRCGVMEVGVRNGCVVVKVGRWKIEGERKEINGRLEGLDG